MRLMHDRLEGITEERKVGICLRAANLRTATALIAALERATLLLQAPKTKHSFLMRPSRLGVYRCARIARRHNFLCRKCVEILLCLFDALRDGALEPKPSFDGIVDVSGACAR